MEKYTPIKRFWKILQPDKRDIYQIFLCAIFSGFIGLSLPLGIQAIINLIQGGRVSASWIVLVIIVVIGAISIGILRLMQMRITENIQQRIFTRAAFEFAFRLPKIKFEALRNQYPPELVNRFFDTINIQKGIAKMFLDYSAAVLQIIFSLILLSLYHPFFIIFGVFLFVLLYLIFRFSFNTGLQTSLKESKYKYKAAHWLQEIARNYASFKNEASHNYAMSKNDGFVVEYLRFREKHFGILVRQFSQLIGFKAIITAGLLLIGGLLVINQKMNIGQFVAAEIVIIGVINSVEKIILGLENFYDVLTAIEKVGQVVDLELEEDYTSATPATAPRNIRLELDSLSFRFPDSQKNILDNINMVVPAGQSLYLEGKNGAGKSTLLKILSGLMQPTSGILSVNGSVFNQNRWAELRPYIGMITSGQTTFEGTILENITFNNPAITDDDLKWALGNAKLNSFIKKLPLGLDTPILTDGIQMPSSVTQKIILARTIITRPKLLLLEDPFDKMDTDQAREIIDFITNPEHPWTLVVIAQNDYWKEKCQRVILLDEGKIIDDSKNG